MNERFDLDTLTAGIETGDRQVLARAITLIESSLPEHRRDARELLRRLSHRTGRAARVAITGVPGVGKSTFLDALGMRLVERGNRIAVLAIDPSSQKSGGSILGDKTRMERLTREERAFVRPSPGSGALGGVAARTREAMLLCEAAGHDVVFIETIGVGQSEAAAADLVDTMVLLLLPGAGDELQGIKRGIVELADVLVVHKADAELLEAAGRTRADYRAALQLLHAGAAWQPPVLACSSAAGVGIDEVWSAVEAHRTALGEAGVTARRLDRAGRWFDEAVLDELRARFLARADVASSIDELRERVRRGELDPTAAADQLLRRAADRADPGSGL